MNTQQQINQAASEVHHEQILVVRRDALFPHEPAMQGIKAENIDEWVQLITANQLFGPREQMEQDPTYKQIIPYLVFKHHDKYFLMQRSAQASEQRLQSKYSLGIGGHIRQEDISSGTIFDWAKREFHEEVAYADALTIKPIGILNDDSNQVGRVHLGLVLLLEGQTEHIAIKSELKSGQLLTLQECHHYYDLMENWSKIVFDFLNR